jgi:Tol biopolymer transport system component
VWNLADPARPVRHLTGPASGYGGGVTSIAFSPDGKILVAGTGSATPTGYGKVWLWNLADPARPAPLGRPLTGTTGPGITVTAVAFSSDGKTLAAGSDNSTVSLWSLADPGRPARLGQPLTGPENNVNSLAFSPDGKILAAGTGDGKVWLWSMADPARPARLGSPLSGPPVVRGTGVNSVAFSPDGKILAGNTGDGSMWLWTLADPAHPALLGQPLTGPASIIGSIAFSPDGQTLAAGTGNGTAQIWNLNVDDAVQRICATTSNTLTPAQWKQDLTPLPYNPPCAHPGHYGLLSH